MSRMAWILYILVITFLCVIYTSEKHSQWSIQSALWICGFSVHRSNRLKMFEKKSYYLYWTWANFFCRHSLNNIVKQLFFSLSIPLRILSDLETIESIQDCRDVVREAECLPRVQEAVGLIFGATAQTCKARTWQMEAKGSGAQDHSKVILAGQLFHSHLSRDQVSDKQKLKQWIF